MLRLKGAVQHYAWGDRFALPELLDVTGDGRPWAEIWFGTHPHGVAQIDESLHLPAPSYLSDEVGELPFIVKLLAAAQPLSLQIHPSAAQAASGFARENTAGVPLEAPHRVYGDDQPKPEMVVALNTFEAVCGFVSAADAIGQCTTAGARDIAEHVERHGVGDTVRAILTGSPFAPPPSPSRAMQKLAEHHDDARSSVALLMHHVRLSPGEALYLDAGCVHAYLSGVALEVQGSSDNVIRAAFTKKHVDLPEFLSIANLTSTDEGRVTTERISDLTTAYRCPAPFSVMRHEVNGAFALTANRQHTMLVCTSGRAGPLTRGAAAYLSAGESVALDGTATLYSVSA